VLDLDQELRAIAAALEAASVTYALVGGIAVSIYTTPRATKDIDVLVAAADLEKLSAALLPLGYRDLAAAMSFAGGRILIRRYTKLAGSEYLVVDVVIPVDGQLVKILAGRQAIGSDKLWIAPLDGLIELKRLRGSPQDMADIAALTGSKP
jgi:hypothetical protein